MGKKEVVKKSRAYSKKVKKRSVSKKQAPKIRKGKGTKKNTGKAKPSKIPAEKKKNPGKKANIAKKMPKKKGSPSKKKKEAIKEIKSPSISTKKKITKKNLKKKILPQSSSADEKAETQPKEDTTSEVEKEPKKTEQKAGKQIDGTAEEKRQEPESLETEAKDETIKKQEPEEAENKESSEDGEADNIKKQKFKSLLDKLKLKKKEKLSKEDYLIQHEELKNKLKLTSKETGKKIIEFEDPKVKDLKEKLSGRSEESEEPEKEEHREGIEIVSTYDYQSKNIPITINILKKKGEFVPIYELKIATISSYTEIFLEKIRKELINEVNLGIIDITDLKRTGIVEERFSETIVNLLNKYFPDIDGENMKFLTTYLIQRSLGLGKLELLRDDPHLEEIAINSSDEPIWVYHREFGWVKTTIEVESEEQTKHFAAMIGRKIGKQVSVLEPLMDANLTTGDRINATIMPISNKGNTITLRRFSSIPWTITKLVRSKTMSAEAASLLWLGIQYEMSLLIAGGTASGKTSTLNAISNFFPPNHRIISIEDTREIRLPSFLHWVPMVTRLPNAEGKGEISMLDLLVNSLRQRPDRILVGEVRRKKEAEVLFEAIHTGHSVYATFHANNASEAITRLTSPPIEVPKTMLPAISMILVQYRNRRSGLRRSFQIAEITEDGNQNVILQYDPKKDIMAEKNKSRTLMDNLSLYTGMDEKEIQEIIKIKSKVLRWMIKHKIEDVDDVGRVIAEYYTNYDNLMKFVNKNKNFFQPKEAKKEGE